MASIKEIYKTNEEKVLNSFNKENAFENVLYDYYKKSANNPKIRKAFLDIQSLIDSNAGQDQEADELKPIFNNISSAIKLREEYGSLPEDVLNLSEEQYTGLKSLLSSLGGDLKDYSNFRNELYAGTNTSDYTPLNDFINLLKNYEKDVDVLKSKGLTPPLVKEYIDREVKGLKLKKEGAEKEISVREQEKKDTLAIKKVQEALPKAIAELGSLGEYALQQTANVIDVAGSNLGQAIQSGLSGRGGMYRQYHLTPEETTNIRKKWRAGMGLDSEEVKNENIYLSSLGATGELLNVPLTTAGATLRTPLTTEQVAESVKEGKIDYPIVSYLTAMTGEMVIDPASFAFIGSKIAPKLKSAIPSLTKDAKTVEAIEKLAAVNTKEELIDAGKSLEAIIPDVKTKQEVVNIINQEAQDLFKIGTKNLEVKQAEERIAAIGNSAKKAAIEEKALLKNKIDSLKIDLEALGKEQVFQSKGAKDYGVESAYKNAYLKEEEFFKNTYKNQDGYTFNELKTSVKTLTDDLKDIQKTNSVEDLFDLFSSKQDEMSQIHLDNLLEMVDEGVDFKVIKNGFEKYVQDEINMLDKQYDKFPLKYIESTVKSELIPQIKNKLDNDIYINFEKGRDNNVAFEANKNNSSFYWTITDNSGNSVKIRLSDHESPIGGGSKIDQYGTIEKMGDADIDLNIINGKLQDITTGKEIKSFQDIKEIAYSQLANKKKKIEEEAKALLKETIKTPEYIERYISGKASVKDVGLLEGINKKIAKSVVPNSDRINTYDYISTKWLTRETSSELKPLTKMVLGKEVDKIENLTKAEVNILKNNMFEKLPKVDRLNISNAFSSAENNIITFSNLTDKQKEAYFVLKTPIQTLQKTTEGFKKLELPDLGNNFIGKVVRKWMPFTQNDAVLGARIKAAKEAYNKQLYTDNIFINDAMITRFENAKLTPERISELAAKTDLYLKNNPKTEKVIAYNIFKDERFLKAPDNLKERYIVAAAKQNIVPIEALTKEEKDAVEILTQYFNNAHNQLSKMGYNVGKLEGYLPSRHISEMKEDIESVYGNLSDTQKKVFAARNTYMKNLQHRTGDVDVLSFDPYDEIKQYSYLKNKKIFIDPVKADYSAYLSSIGMQKVRDVDNISLKKKTNEIIKKQIENIKTQKGENFDGFTEDELVRISNIKNNLYAEAAFNPKEGSIEALALRKINNLSANQNTKDILSFFADKITDNKVLNETVTNIPVLGRIIESKHPSKEFANESNKFFASMLLGTKTASKNTLQPLISLMQSDIDVAIKGTAKGLLDSAKYLPDVALGKISKHKPSKQAIEAYNNAVGFVSDYHKTFDTVTSDNARAIDTIKKSRKLFEYIYDTTLSIMLFPFNASEILMRMTTYPTMKMQAMRDFGFTAKEANEIVELFDNAVIKNSVDTALLSPSTQKKIDKMALELNNPTLLEAAARAKHKEVVGHFGVESTQVAKEESPLVSSLTQFGQFTLSMLGNMGIDTANIVKSLNKATTEKDKTAAFELIRYAARGILGYFALNYIYRQITAKSFTDELSDYKGSPVVSLFANIYKYSKGDISEEDLKSLNIQTITPWIYHTISNQPVEKDGKWLIMSRSGRAIASFDNKSDAWMATLTAFKPKNYRDIIFSKEKEEKLNKEKFSQIKVFRKNLGKLFLEQKNAESAEKKKEIANKISEYLSQPAITSLYSTNYTFNNAVEDVYLNTFYPEYEQLKREENIKKTQYQLGEYEQYDE